MKKILKFLIGLSSLSLLLSGCVFSKKESSSEPSESSSIHEHTFADEWSYDDEFHWHQATCEHSELVSGKEAHAYGDWIIVTEPTEESEGYKYKECSVCGYTLASYIPKLDHAHVAGDPVRENEKPATCLEDGSYDSVIYCTACGEEMSRTTLPIDALGHSYVFDSYITYPTRERDGLALEICERCDHQHEVAVDRLEGIDIHVYDGDDLVKTYYLDEDGKYNLEIPTLEAGYCFYGYLDENDDYFPLSGTLTESVDIYIYKALTPYQAATLAELKAGIANGASFIELTDSFQIDETIYVNHDLTLTANNYISLIRNKNFGGDLFVVGEDSEGNPSIYNGISTTLSIKPAQDKKIYIDGNKEVIYEFEDPTVVVKGSAFFVTVSANLNIYEGTQIENNKKTSNERIFNYVNSTDDSLSLLSSPEKVGGAAICNVYGQVSIYGGKISDNEIGGDTLTNGGAIYSLGTTNIHGGYFKNNKGASGSVIYELRTLNITYGTFDSNIATSYGAVYAANSQYCEIRITPEIPNDVVFTQNEAGSSGGAIFVALQASLYIEGALFDRNTAASNGGAISSKGIVNISDGHFVSNVCGSKGGAIYEYYGSEDDSTVSRSVRIYNSTFEKNEGPLGAAVAFGNSIDDANYPDYVNHAEGLISNCLFEDNAAVLNKSDSYGHGGCIYMQKKSSVTIFDSDFNNNSAVGNGGVFYVTTSSNLSIGGDCTIQNNSAKGGGALYVTDGGSVSATATRFHNNSCTNNGGALYMYTNARGEFYNCSVKNNTATNYGGGAYISGKAIVKFYNITSDTNSAKTGGFVYITTTGSELYIYSGSSLHCTATTTDSENIYSNTNKCTVYIKDTNTKTSFDYDGTLISGAYTLEDITDE